MRREASWHESQWKRMNSKECLAPEDVRASEKHESAVFLPRQQHRGSKTASAHMRFVEEKLRFELQRPVVSLAALVNSH